LYSYLVFEFVGKDSSAERARHLAALEAYLRMLQPIEEYMRARSRSQLNITLIPVKRAVKLPAEFHDPMQIPQSAKDVLAVYDYARANSLLDDIGKNVARNGPYFISRIPTEPSAARLFIDMSHVAPDLVADWTQMFRWLSAEKRSWSETKLTQLMLNTRNAISIAAKNTPEVAAALPEWIRLIKVK
jgi:hypothetical protein